MPIESIFLDWTRPCLAMAAERLLSGFSDKGEADLGGVAVVVPGARAGRRLVEILVASAEARRLRLVPPRVLTPAGLGDLLAPSDVPLAGELARALAWGRALDAAGAAARLAVAPGTPDGNPAARIALGELLDRLHAEIAGEGLTFGDVAEKGESMPDFTDGDRWRALEAVRGAYLEELAKAGLADPQEARRAPDADEAARDGLRVILLATTDLNALQRRLLDRPGIHVETWIHAPESLAKRFDAHGCVIPDAWRDGAVGFDPGRIEIADGPADQAAAALRALAGTGGGRAPDASSVGIGDPDVLPFLEEAFAAAGVPFRPAAGLPVLRSGPARLLEAAVGYVAGRDAAGLAALGRHPDLGAWLERPEGGGVPPEWIEELDDYRAEHLPVRLGDGWLGEAKKTAALRRAVAALDGLLAPWSGDSRPVGEWAEPLLGLLVGVYGGRPLDRKVLDQRVVLETCDRLLDVLREFRELPAGWGPVTDARTAVELVRRRLEPKAIPPEGGGAAVEGLGWLELPLDDALALVVTGFNEGFVPESLNADAFLPEGLRRHVGLLDNARRFARDACALSAILASRPGVRLIAGRRSADGDPLLPSRLLFGGDPADAPRRVLTFFPEDRPAVEAEPPLPAGLRPGGVSRFAPPGPDPAIRRLESLSVTAFRDYLACPYRFYLRRVLKLKSPDDGAEELDALGFGGLAHEALEDFGKGPEAGASDARAIRAFLDDALARRVAERFGASPPSPVRVQVEQLRGRLHAFAEAQALRRAGGWTIRNVEFDAGKVPAPFLRGGEPFFLTGRIDRIDVHEGTGEIAILDYKTYETAKTPEKVHRRKKSEWTDLQLPLYRHLAATAGIRAARLGYFLLTHTPADTGVREAEWTDEDLAAADDAARRVVEGIRAGIFTPRAPRTPDFMDEFDPVCGVGLPGRYGRRPGR